MNNINAGISVVVPAYNSEQSISLLVQRLETVLVQIGGPYELILVNDGSRDGSWAGIESLVKARSCVSGINLMRNFGQHNALLCGIRQARYATTVTIDDDLQNPPEEIGRLLAELETGFDVVYGYPETQQHGLWRDLASWLTKLALQGAMGAATARSVSAFRAFRTQIREAFAGYRSPFVSIDVLLTWGTTKFGVVTVRHETRTLGRSNYTFRRLSTHALNMMTGFSIRPLQIASLAGFAFMLFGGGILAYVVVKYMLNGGVVPGFSFLACTIAILSGAQLFSLGVIGEYLARMHFRTMDKPIYVVRDIISSKSL